MKRIVLEDPRGQEVRKGNEALAQAVQNVSALSKEKKIQMDYRRIEVEILIFDQTSKLKNLQKSLKELTLHRKLIEKIFLNLLVKSKKKG
jgi:hypothetical protein